MRAKRIKRFYSLNMIFCITSNHFILQESREPLRWSNYSSLQIWNSALITTLQIWNHAMLWLSYTFNISTNLICCLLITYYFFYCNKYHSPLASNQWETMTLRDCLFFACLWYCVSNANIILGFQELHLWQIYFLNGFPDFKFNAFWNLTY